MTFDTSGSCGPGVGKPLARLGLAAAAILVVVTRVRLSKFTDREGSSGNVFQKLKKACEKDWSRN